MCVEKNKKLTSTNVLTPILIKTVYQIKMLHNEWHHSMFNNNNVK